MTPAEAGGAGDRGRQGAPSLDLIHRSNCSKPGQEGRSFSISKEWHLRIFQDGECVGGAVFDGEGRGVANHLGWAWNHFGDRVQVGPDGQLRGADEHTPR